MTNSAFYLAEPKNETVLDYGPGSEEKSQLKERLIELKSKPIDIPLIID